MSAGKIPDQVYDQAYYEALESALKDLLDALSPVFSEAERQEVQHFLDVGEYGVAFETLCGIITEEQKTIPAPSVSLIRTLADRMQIDPHWWGAIVNL